MAPSLQHTKAAGRVEEVSAQHALAVIATNAETQGRESFIVVYYETMKRELNKRLIYECRCGERLKAKAERSTRLAYTVLRGGLEHLKIKTSIFRVIRKAAALARMLPHFELRIEENATRRER